jgi:hypothetical protein
MNSIRLNRPTLLKGKYVVFFDSNNRFAFTDKRQASDFLVKVSRELDIATLLITEELSILHTIYRLYYLADKDYKFKFKLNNSLEIIINRLNWMNNHSGSPNHNVILFNSLLTCFNELIFSFKIMQLKAATRKDTLTKRRCALKIDILKLYLEKFLGLGIKPEIQILPMAVAYKKTS